MTYTPSDSRLIPGLESFGEYVRNTAIVNIIDNDSKFLYLPASDPISFCAGLQINFEESDYSITEGVSVLSDTMTLTFRSNQNPFSVILTPVTIDTAQNMGLGSFINFDNIARTFRATAGVYYKHCGINSFSFPSGDDFTYEPLAIKVPANLQRYTIQQFFNVVDDNFDEDEQSFAIVAEIGPDVPDGISCFQTAVGVTECFGRCGATQIRITDNDRKFLIL